MLILFLLQQGLSQDLETGWPKFVIVKLLGIQFFKADHNIIILQPQTCISSLKLGITSLHTAMGIILRWKTSILCLKLTFKFVILEGFGMSKKCSDTLLARSIYCILIFKSIFPPRRFFSWRILGMNGSAPYCPKRHVV